MGRMVLVTVILVALVTVPVVAAVPTFNTTRLYSETAFAAAIKPYTEAIARNPNDADAHRWLGVAYFHMYRLYKMGFAPYAGAFGAKAVESLERSIQLRPDLAVMMTLAEAYITMGQPAKSSALVSRGLEGARPAPPR